MIEDGNTDSGKSATAAQKLISVDNVQAMFLDFTGPSSAVSPISEQDKMPMIYDALASQPVEQNPYAFKFFFDMQAQCYSAAKYLVNHGHKTIGGLVLNLDFNADCQKGMQQAIAGTDGKIIMYSPDETTVDFRTFITKMKQDGVDSVVAVLYEDNAVAFFKQRADLGFSVPVVEGIDKADGLTEKVTSSVNQKALEGVITYDQDFDSSFTTKIKSAYPDINDKDILEAAFGYDMTMYLYKAVSACGSNPSCIVDNLIHSDYKTVLTSGGFGENRILKLTPIWEVYTNGAFQKIDING